MTTTKPADTQIEELSPSYRLPLALIVGAGAICLLQPWLGGAIALFGVFLFIQAATIRLKFTAAALEVYRSTKLIRSFPYSEWQNWRIFWSPVPILFYFREVNSIHFLPVLFSPQQLQSCLETYYPLKQD